MKCENVSLRGNTCHCRRLSVFSRSHRPVCVVEVSSMHVWQCATVPLVLSSKVCKYSFEPDLNLLKEIMHGGCDIHTYIPYTHMCIWLIFMRMYVWEMYADKILSDNSWRIQVCVTYIVTTGSGIRFHVIKFPPKTPFRRSQERYVQYGCIVAPVMVMRRSINLFMGNRRSGGHFIPCKKDTACDRTRNSIYPVSKSRFKSLHAFGTQGWFIIIITPAWWSPRLKKDICSISPPVLLCLPSPQPPPSSLPPVINTHSSSHPQAATAVQV